MTSNLNLPQLQNIFLSSPIHTANDFQLVPIEKIFSNQDSIQKAWEAFLIQKGRTIILSRWSEHPPRNLVIVFLYYVNLLFTFTLGLSLIYTVKWFYLFPVICYIKHVRCKIHTVPEEGWFGQPKYSTPA